MRGPGRGTHDAVRHRYDKHPARHLDGGYVDRMKTGRRGMRVGSGAAFGAAVAITAGSTPIGVAIVAGLGGTLAWRTGVGTWRARR